MSCNCLERKKSQDSMLTNPENKKIYIHKHVSIMVIYHLFINSSLSESNKRHLILALPEGKNDLL